ncbi:oocyte zinc finger protein XlCOF29-like isoform X2 [Artemia franciscana]|uniref:oocyte zinc finger protein XlCOF29-like isoform X2 n=1 Tax=Artemia franciscana TaxID=6661 RepID=UPI0032DBBB32
MEPKNLITNPIIKTEVGDTYPSDHDDLVQSTKFFSVPKSEDIDTAMAPGTLMQFKPDPDSFDVSLSNVKEEEVGDTYPSDHDDLVQSTKFLSVPKSEDIDTAMAPATLMQFKPDPDSFDVSLSNVKEEDIKLKLPARSTIFILKEEITFASDYTNLSPKEELDPLYVTLETIPSNVQIMSTAEERKNKIAVSQKDFSNKSVPTKRRRTQYREKTYDCASCEKMYTTKTSLNRHVRSHHCDKLFECYKCSKTFSLSKHYNIFCSLCRKRFVQKPNLKNHVKIHTGNRL